jgi:acetyl esterase
MRTIAIGLLLVFSTFLYAQDGFTPQQFRHIISQSIADLKVPAQPVASVQDTVIGNGIDTATLRIYKPASSGKFPVVYFIHGGVWVAGDLNTHDNICRVIANRLQAIVVSVGYRQPPEYPFPVSHNDVYFGFRWTASHAARLGGNGKLIIMGDSAGGLFTAATCATNAASKKPVPVTAQVLINPALDLRPGSPTDTTYGFFIKWGIKPTDNRNDVRLSPLAATDFSKLPPAVIVVGEWDEIRDDGIRYDQKLKAARVKSALYKQPNEGHLAEYFCAAHDKAKPAIDFIVASLKGQYLKR